MTTKQTDAKQMADRELDQVNGGMYLPGYDGPIRPLAFVMKRRSNRTRCTENNNTGFTQASRPVLPMLLGDDPVV